MTVSTITELAQQCTTEAGSADFSVVDQICHDLFSSKVTPSGPAWHSLLRRIFAEAVRNNLTNEDLSGALGEAPFTDQLLAAYEKYREDAAKAFESVGFHYPHLVEAQWKISGLMESDSEKRIKAPLCEMTLKSIPTGTAKPEAFTFVCTKDELLELQGIVADAESMLAKLSQK
uniref:COMM domain-containing protein n=1 Tax=Panagrellus redivivus TaxID=6233 RepID=A0A7E4VV67_PANRE